MLGEMQDFPLRVTAIIDHAAKYHADRAVRGRTAEGGWAESNWGEVARRARMLASKLVQLGLEKGDCIGVMAWNTVRHMEVWYGVAGAGMVNHTLNPRLFQEQLEYIIGHAPDKAIMIDADLVKVLEGLAAAGKLPSVQHYIVLTDREHMPETTLPNAICYEEWVADGDPEFDWVEVAETDPSGLCYTSGTTGNPKGVMYSNRSNVLHALFSLAPDCVGLHSREVVTPIVPLFHANGWGIAYTAPMVGAEMIMPGRDMTPAGIYEVLSKGVTFTAAVPTIWLGLLPYMKQNDLKLETLERVVIGGSSCPRAVIEAFQNEYGVQVIHAWGMTEMSPLGTVCTLKPEVMARDEKGRVDAQCTVGHPPFGVDLKITDDDGNELPWDAEAQGRLLVRGPGVVKRYHNFDDLAVDGDDWFDTGDVATVDPHAYVRITDRSKDVIKSGGEWISSIELENAAVAHPQVAEAAAIGVPHAKWGERPIICVVGLDGAKPPKEEVLAEVEKHFAKWQIPDDVVYLDSLPHTATGKISKLELRKILNGMNYKHPEAA